MKKRIFSYFLILFLSFIFLKSVYAEHYYFEKFNYFDTSEYSNFLNLRDHFKFINDYLNRVYLEKNIDVCFINSGYPAIICYSADLDNLHYNSNFIGSYLIDISSSYLLHFSNESDNGINLSFLDLGSFSRNFTFYIDYGLDMNYIDIPVWIRPDFIYKGTDTLSFSDNAYNSFDLSLKQYYNFKDYLVPNKPVYSFFNLFLGNVKQHKSLTLNVCLDNNCDLSKTLDIDIDYINGSDVINIVDFLPKQFENYFLDTSKDYSIVPDNFTSLNIYYYSKPIEYSIFYYFDDVLQSDRTIVKSGLIGSTISINDLDPVIDNIYFLDDSIDYSFILSNELNYINIYYRTIPVDYHVNIFLDDIYYLSYSSTLTGKVGEEIILNDLLESINIYNLDQREYKLVLTDNSDHNNINVYYFSNNYNTKYQDIDTSDKFFISFDWIYIKDLFNLKGDFTQTEQFIIVYVVNFLFYAILFLFSYLAIKMINKLFSLFNLF